MPLQDHFHPPLSGRRHWQAFHNAWATKLAEDLNLKLPERYFAEPNVQFGIEIDVATLKEHDASSSSGQPAESEMAPRASAWSPPAPTMTMPFPLVEDIVEIAVFNGEAGPELVGAIEFVSPANKDRRETRDAFIAKCRAYLQQGVGLIVVDIVTSRLADLHSDLLAALQSGSTRSGAPVPTSTGQQISLQAAAYRPMGRDSNATLAIWREVLSLQKALPTLPLCLRGGICLPVELEETYERTRGGLRMQSL